MGFARTNSAIRRSGASFVRYRKVKSPPTDKSPPPPDTRFITAPSHVFCATIHPTRCPGSVCSGRRTDISSGWIPHSNSASARTRRRHLLRQTRQPPPASTQIPYVGTLKAHGSRSLLLPPSRKFCTLCVQTLLSATFRIFAIQSSSPTSTRAPSVGRRPESVFISVYPRNPWLLFVPKKFPQN